MTGPDSSRTEATPDPVPVEIVVDLAAIRHNVRALADHVARTDAGERPVALMAVVKADGYGHGMVEVAGAAREAGASWLGVATPGEAMRLRESGDRGRLLCWLTTPADVRSGLLRRVIAADVDVAAYDVAGLRTVVEQAGGATPRVHLKVDTGLSRGGAPREQWPAFFAEAAALEQAGRVVVAGIWSHLVASDEPEHPANDAQERAFADAVALAEEAGVRPEVRHLANSAAALLRPSIHHDLVRCGIATYGLDPAPGISPEVGLVPAMTVRAPLVMVKDVEAGTGVSYGHLWTAPTATTLGLVPAGYADGIPRHASDRAEVWSAGARRPMRGRVCMDQFVIELGDDRPEVGSEVLLFGPGTHGEPTAQEWAEAAGTISYEVVTRIGGRFARRHVDSEVDSGADSGADSGEGGETR
jgi:alanine racemase